METTQKIIRFQQEKTEQIGRNWVGNIYRKEWVAYVLDNRKESYGSWMTLKGKDYPVRRIIFKNKKELRKFIESNINISGKNLNKMEEKITCTKCESKEVTKRGFRYTENREKVQKYFCKDCKHRFVLDNPFFRMRNNQTPSQIAVPNIQIKNKNGWLELIQRGYNGN